VTVLAQPAARVRRWPVGRVLLVVSGLLVLLVVGIGAASWLLASLLINPHHDLVRRDVTVLALRPGAIVLSRETATERPGTYGLDWPGGRAIVGSPLASGSGSVTRRLISLRGRLTRGTKVGVDPDVWQGNPWSTLAIPFRPIHYPDPLGPMPGWFVPGRGTTWVIFVHGLDGTIAGGLRPLITLHQLGLPTLLMAYRNDYRAPPDPSGHITLGMSEWDDLDWAARWAVSHGASHLILYGDSMGGSIVTRFMHISKFAGQVSALVLDAPALDWGGMIDHIADRYHLPFMGPALRWAIGQRAGIDWGALNEIAQAQDFNLPILLFQGEQDLLVPPSESQAFARAAPGPVTYVPTPGAGHVESWNANPTAYEQRLRAFLSRFAPRH
jgi:alpha-beta hydrolase superfamily lysophospholipase